MEKLTIKLLHERKSRNPRRKIDGVSGAVFLFRWSDEHDAYCYTTSIQDEADDLFNSQGRRFGSFFAPVITIEKQPEPKPLAGEIVLALIDRGLDMPKLVAGETDREAVALAILAAYDRGHAIGVKDTAKQFERPPAPAPAITLAENLASMGEGTTTTAQFEMRTPAVPEVATAATPPAPVAAEQPPLSNRARKRLERETAAAAKTQSVPATPAQAPAASGV